MQLDWWNLLGRLASQSHILSVLCSTLYGQNLTKKTKVQILCCSVSLGQILHSTLLQFTEQYESVPVGGGGGGGYFCTNSLCAIIAAWLDASQGSQDGV